VVAALICATGFAIVIADACSDARPRAANTQRPESVAAQAVPTTQPTSRDTSAVVTPQGYGAIRIGASAEQLADAIGSKIPPSHSPDERECRYVMLAALPSGMRVMLVHDSVARIDITAVGPRTAGGIGIGDAEPHVVAAYGDRATVRPNKYTGPVGHDIIVNATADSTHRLIFETDGKKVVRYRAGRQPAVDLVEGCG
jgi:hypothetical protein